MTGDPKSERHPFPSTLVQKPMKKHLFLVVLFGLSTVLYSGCGGRQATVVQPAETEPVDLSAQAAEEHPEEYANMVNSQ